MKKTSRKNRKTSGPRSLPLILVPRYRFLKQRKIRWNPNFWRISLPACLTSWNRRRKSKSSSKAWRETPDIAAWTPRRISRRSSKKLGATRWKSSGETTWRNYRLSSRSWWRMWMTDRTGILLWRFWRQTTTCRRERILWFVLWSCAMTRHIRAIDYWYWSDWLNTLPAKTFKYIFSHFIESASYKIIRLKIL